MGKINKMQMVKVYILNEYITGRIKNGSRLPSCRKVASLLSVNKITVNKAYRELESEHKVYSIPRGGFYFVDSGQVSLCKQESLDFSTVKPDDKLIPYREFTHVINKAVDLYKNSLFGYESTIGLGTLRNTIKSLFEQEGIYTTPDRIVITHGAQQAISLVFQVLFQNNKNRLLVEVPTYSLALKFAEYLGISTVGIARRIDGYDYNEMENLFKNENILAFYVIPRHHNPTGYTLSENDKKIIAELANKYNVWIIEDDYLADVGHKKGSMPIHYYDIHKRSIYIRSFSKTFMPGIRIGAAVVPESMIEGVAKLKYLSDLNTSRLPQAALDMFITSGMYEKHAKKVRKSYEVKLRKAKEIFRNLSPKNLTWNVPEYGIFIWLQLPDSIDMIALVKKLKNQGIIITEASDFFLRNEIAQGCDSQHLKFIRLCIAGIPEKDIGTIAAIILAIQKEILV